MSLTIQKDTAIAAIHAVTGVQPLLQRMEEAHHKGNAATQQSSALAQASTAYMRPADASTASAASAASGAEGDAASAPEAAQGFAGPDSSAADVPPVLETPGLPPADDPYDVPDEGAEFEFDDVDDDGQDAYIERLVTGAAADAPLLPLWPGLSLAAARADNAAARSAPTPAQAGTRMPAAQSTPAQLQNEASSARTGAGKPSGESSASTGAGKPSGEPSASAGPGKPINGSVSPAPLSVTPADSPGIPSAAMTHLAELPPPVTAAGAALRALREADARAQAARAASAASATAPVAGADQNRMSTRTAQAPAPEAGAAADGRDTSTAPLPAVSTQEAAAQHTAEAATGEAAQTRGEAQTAVQRSVQHVQQAQKTQEMLAKRAHAESRVDFSFNSWGAGHTVVARQQGGQWILQPSSTRVSQALGSSAASDGMDMRLNGDGQGVDAALDTDPDGRRRQQQEQDTP